MKKAEAESKFFGSYGCWTGLIYTIVAIAFRLIDSSVYCPQRKDHLGGAGKIGVPPGLRTHVSLRKRLDWQDS